MNQTAQAHSGEEIGYDELIFRCVEAARGIGHIPKVLYHYKVGVQVICVRRG